MIDHKNNPNKIIKNPRDNDYEQSKPKARQVLGGLAAAGALGIASWMGQSNEVDSTPLKPTVTTEVIAEEGDSLLGLQQKEGLNGMPVDEARRHLSELNGGNIIVPGQKIILMDNIDNNQASQASSE